MTTTLGTKKDVGDFEQLLPVVLPRPEPILRALFAFKAFGLGHVGYEAHRISTLAFASQVESPVCL